MIVLAQSTLMAAAPVAARILRRALHSGRWPKADSRRFVRLISLPSHSMVITFDTSISLPSRYIITTFVLTPHVIARSL